ncbi:hypothetical protein GW17_00043408 [Ensete ventricosum]|nr:hypothetical protein GW17_00043408 [Ensete ventricosum]
MYHRRPRMRAIFLSCEETKCLPARGERSRRHEVICKERRFTRSGLVFERWSLVGPFCRVASWLRLLSGSLLDMPLGYTDNLTQQAYVDSITA